MDKNENFKMRCIDPRYHKSPYTKDKIYKVENGRFCDDNGHVFTVSLTYFQEWQQSSSAEWELVEDEILEIDKNFTRDDKLKLEKLQETNDKLKEENIELIKIINKLSAIIIKMENKEK